MPQTAPSLLVERGIVDIVVNDSPMTKPPKITADSFPLGGREFHFHKAGTHSPTTVSKSVKLLAALTRSTFNEVALRPTFSNITRRAEVFSPVNLTQGNDELGAYIYPWLREYQNTLTQIPTILTPEIYNTAGCLFGASLVGKDGNGGKFPLVKYKIKFFPGQKITKVLVEEDSLYEALQFEQVKITARLIAQVAGLNGKKELVYHMPYFDYALYAINLFVAGHIEPLALETFFREIYKRKEVHSQKIREICAAQGVNVQIQSPFEKIFTSDIKNENDFVQAIVSTFSFLKEEKNKPNTEKEFIDLCIKKLRQADNHVHTAIWYDYLDQKQTWTGPIVPLAQEQSLVGANAPEDILDSAAWFSSLTQESSKEINTLEDLLKAGNFVIPAMTAKGRRDCEVCSVHSIGEKQIQVHYDEVSKTEHKYPRMLHLTLLDSVVAYDSNNEENSGALFYFDTRGIESKTIKEQLKTAQQNTAKMGVSIKSLTSPATLLNKGYRRDSAASSSSLASIASPASTASSSSSMNSIPSFSLNSSK